MCKLVRAGARHLSCSVTHTYNTLGPAGAFLAQPAYGEACWDASWHYTINRISLLSPPYVHAQHAGQWHTPTLRYYCILNSRAHATCWCAHDHAWGTSCTLVQDHVADLQLARRESNWPVPLRLPICFSFPVIPFIHKARGLLIKSMPGFLRRPHAIFLLRSTLCRGFGGMDSPDLFKKAHHGTKDQIEQYVDEVRHAHTTCCVTIPHTI